MKHRLYFAALVLGVFLARWFYLDHQQFLRFTAQRDAWHRRCDAYIDGPAITPTAKACAAQLTELTAEMQRHSWDR